MSENPTLAELARTLGRIETDMRDRFSELAGRISLMVTRDLYEAQRTAMVEDITELREELRAQTERRAADRRMLLGAVVAAVLSLVVTVVGAALVAAIGLGGAG